MILQKMSEILKRNNIDSYIEDGYLLFKKYHKIRVAYNDILDYDTVVGGKNLPIFELTENQDIASLKECIESKEIYDFSKKVVDLIDAEMSNVEIGWIKLDINSFSPKLTGISNENFWDYLDGKITYK